MNPQKIFFVARHELLSTLQRRSALFVIFGLPVLSLLLLTGINWLSNSQSGPNGAGGSSSSAAAQSFITNFALSGNDSTLPIGLVDETNRITELPAHTFVPLSDRAAAEAAFAAGEIRAFYLVPADYLQSGTLYLYAKAVMLSGSKQAVIENLLAQVFVSQDVPIQRVLRPITDYQEVNQSLQETPVVSSAAMNSGLGYVFGILFYLTTMGASGYLLQSLGKEKETRVLEVLLSSLRPFDLLAGKILGLGVVGLLQMAVWTVLAVFVFRDGAPMFRNIQLPALPLGVWFVVVAHFLVGYLVYASLFAGLGAMTPGLKESSQYTFFIMLPTFLPLWFATEILSTPNSRFSLFLSLFPLTSGVAMPMRLGVTAVAPWQWLLSLSLAFLTSLGTLWLAVRLFKGKNLLAGQSLTVGNLWRALRGA